MEDTLDGLEFRRLLPLKSLHENEMLSLQTIILETHPETK